MPELLTRCTDVYKRQHRQITEAIEKHDPVAARTAMYQHLIYNRDKMLEKETLLTADREVKPETEQEWQQKTE